MKKLILLSLLSLNTNIYAQEYVATIKNNKGIVVSNEINNNTNNDNNTSLCPEGQVVVNRTELDNMIANNEDYSNVCTAYITDMSNLFIDKSVNYDISQWDTSNVTDMTYLFKGSDFNGDISQWNVSNVTDMSAMFWSAPSANPDVSGWDTSKVATMQNMFNSASSADPDMSGWDLTSIANMSNFANFSGLSTANYDNLLVQLDATAVNTITLDVGSTNYTSAGAGGTARGNLVGKGWTINDGGGI